MTIRGKTYKAKYISVLVFEQFMFLMDRMMKAREEGRFDEYEKAWAGVCAAMLEGDTSDLSLDKINPTEMKEITDFFTLNLGETTKTLQSGNAISPDSPEGTA